ncbi:MAG: type I-C CRISPR-associated protein Cas8c/Csd1 [Desulfuromonadales bacterium]|nr:type I-C CRISPR-associated protein Cas8c/Csd1 [Desulfuromonadales bacterium]MBN2791685.1 type I-C CRISPR-associated protein Cas8c/Csd1 [Desulfuromonadales bacterium]
MIFQSLIGLYDRLAATGNVPPYGFSVEDIGFVVTIDNDGNLIGQPEDLRVKNSSSFDFRQSVVPYTNQVNVRANAAAKTPNFMVDKADYIFGMSGNSKKDVHHQSFKQLIDEVCEGSTDQGVLAARSFLADWNPEDSVELRDWKEICGPHGKWVAFRLQGDSSFIHEREEVQKLWVAYLKKESFLQGINFIDGKVTQLQSQYAQFKFGSGASMVSFNEVAYESYGKKKGENAPISVEAEFKSSAALKFLLRSRTQRLRIGDAVTIFWAEKASPVETFMGQILNPSIQDDGAALPVQKFLQAVKQGALPNDLEKDKELKFYILGVSVNKARLALRFWHICSVSDLMERLRDHFDNLEMERSEKDISFPGIWHLLKETVRETKDISPVLGGALMRSIVTGAAYPQSLYQAVINRIRAEQSKKNPQTDKAVPNVNYLRASILKAFLNRNYNLEVQMALDETRREDGYLLGRLFAVLESAQRDALGKINSSIKDRFYSAASTIPASVFPSLVRMAQNHIEKAEYGHLSERRIAQILEHIKKFPNYMDMQEQGLFAIAYYQQKNAISREIKEAVANKQSESQEVGQ